MAETIVVYPDKFSNEGKIITVLNAQHAKRNDGREFIASLRCFCGNTFTSTLSKVRANVKKSCGCIGKSNRRGVPGGNKTHPLYHRWAAMIQRCTNANNPKFASYGARGITVCDAWLSFPAYAIYIDSSLGESPSSSHSIDRIDNMGNYVPGNVRWATAQEQSRNTRKTRPEYASDCVSRKEVSRRVLRGLSIEDAVSIPVGRLK